MGLLLSAGLVLTGAAVVGLSMGWLGSLTAAAPVGIVTASLFTHYVDVDAAGAVLAGTWVLVAVVAVLAPALRDLDPDTIDG